MTPIITVTLPWPSAALSPNGREHYQTKAKAVKAAQELAMYTVIGKMDHFPVHSGLLSLTLQFYPPDKRWRDDDNMISMCKSYRDGIFQALGLNDHLVRRTTGERFDPVSGGKVIISVEYYEGK